jgi:PTEN phosphatase family protein
MIDDHNVPSLSDMLRFAENVREWLDTDPDNVIVVHCKGGKVLKVCYVINLT